MKKPLVSIIMGSDSDLEIIIQESIQRQIKKYIDVIESNLKKFLKAALGFESFVKAKAGIYL